MPNSYTRREDRKKQIVEALEGLVNDGKTPEGTAYKIAKLLGITVNWNLYSVLAEMVTDGQLNIREEIIVNRCTRTFYILPEGTYSTKHQREIKINGKLWYTQEGF